ncbi:permease [Tissierella carlieri]|uniref:Efflux transporter SaoE n=1 Tax=Tissierella carlieri TaxID=689904 RepID=A0ABT1SBR9_9FIRM|nr:efflux transporter SaoE [Tissierella carlieri]MBU5313231.1 permease [Tissierella carlieri]MCQ4923913.1 efflux transporter SaoE [Tissierella carlieri]MDU5082576.1 efflux transporter SaoE [Bacillota bacterium]
MLLLDFLKNILLTSISLLNGTSGWLVFSYIIAGLLHDVISPVRFHKHLGNTKISSILKVTISGMCLPICSCGTIPLGISLYYSGAYVGPTLAFMASTPALNPIALILSYGLLGKELTIINIVAGFLLPFIIGIIGNKLGGNEVCKPNLENEISTMSLDPMEETTLLEKFKSGMQWVMGDLAVVLSKYVVLGMLFGGFILTAFPDSFIQKYLGNPSMLSLWNVAVLSAFMYVCAVGHIPFIAALIASGASPGAAITFLMAGAATNFPELLSIYKMIGKKTAIIYGTVISVFALTVGYLTNLWLMPGFEPAINYNRIDSTIESANKLLFTIPEPLKYICSFIVFLFFLKSMYPKVRDLFGKLAEQAR